MTLQESFRGCEREMWRTAMGGLMAVHGLITIMIWAPSPKDDAPMDTSRSWLLGDARAVSVVLAVAAGILLAAAGAGFLAHQDWWSLLAVAGGVLSLLLFGIFFTPWWLLGITISVAVLIVALRERLPG